MSIFEDYGAFNMVYVDRQVWYGMRGQSWLIGYRLTVRLIWYMWTVNVYVVSLGNIAYVEFRFNMVYMDNQG